MTVPKTLKRAFARCRCRSSSDKVTPAMSRAPTCRTGPRSTLSVATLRSFEFTRLASSKYPGTCQTQTFQETCICVSCRAEIRLCSFNSVGSHREIRKNARLKPLRPASLSGSGFMWSWRVPAQRTRTSGTGKLGLGISPGARA